MPRPERAASPEGFRQQVLSRLRTRATQERTSAQRLQQRVAFEQLLARLSGDPVWVLKRGFALELRYGWSHRPTRDIDLRFGDEVELDSLVDALRTAVATSVLDDGFTYEFGDVADELQGAPGGSLRVAVVARLSGQVFARFHIDLSRGDALVGDPDMLEGSDLLAFAGIARVRFPVYPVAQHLAEKLHAYSLPRNQVNKRVKDLVDMVAITAIDRVTADVLMSSVRATFETRHAPDPERAGGCAHFLARGVCTAGRRFADGADGRSGRSRRSGAQVLGPAPCWRRGRSGVASYGGRLEITAPSPDIAALAAYRPPARPSTASLAAGSNTGTRLLDPGIARSRPSSPHQ